MTIEFPAQPPDDGDELPFGGEIALERALERVVQLCESCEQARARTGELPRSLSAQVLRELDRLVDAFDRAARYSLPDRVARLGANVRAVLLPHGAFVDRCLLQLPAARAVQHQRELLARELGSVIAGGEGRPVHVTSLAAGPARELFELYARLDEPRVLVSTLVDLDPVVLERCAAEQARLELGELVELVRANLIHVAVGLQTLELPPQDFIYSTSLIEYFDDALVVKLLDRIHGMLRPGGRVMLGNIHPRNPMRAIMDHVLGWKLEHRDENGLDALFRASAFGRRCSRIEYEPQRIRLFAECVKA